MTDLTPELNKLLKELNAPSTADPSLTLQNIDDFLKEAYRIVCCRNKRPFHGFSLLTPPIRIHI